MVEHFIRVEVRIQGVTCQVLEDGSRPDQIQFLQKTRTNLLCPFMLRRNQAGPSILFTTVLVSPKADVTNYHTVGGLRQRKLRLKRQLSS